jgi:hypothetical protein
VQQDEKLKKAFDLLAEVSKQLITLSTGILALTITFAKDLIKPADAPVWLIKASWVLYVLSIVFGVLTLSTVAGNLEESYISDKPPTLYAKSIGFYHGTQMILFGIATALIVAFALSLSPAPGPPPIPPAAP